MSEAALTPTPTTPPSLPIKVVLRDTWRLYRDLFARTIVVAGIVFGTGYAVLALVAGSGAGAGAALFTLLGTALVQGALVEAVNDVHEGRAVASIRGLYRSSWSRMGTVAAVSILSGLGIGLGLLAFVVPGLVLMTRWSLAVPVAVLERLPARAALRRSREIVRGHGWAVFRVVLNVGVAAGILGFFVQLPVALVLGHGHPLAAFVLGETLGAAITLPYAAHAMSVVYYRLTEPERPVIAAEPARSWESVWGEQDRQAA